MSMHDDIIITREIAPLPARARDAHKGDFGRVVVIGGCCNDAAAMVGAPALAANGALRAGAGLVQVMVPKEIRAAVISLAPCVTARTLLADAAAILQALEAFQADVVALGPGLGDSLSPLVVAELVREFPGALVVDADALNALAAAPSQAPPMPDRVVLTPHPGEARRLLDARGIDQTLDRTPATRRAAALALVEAYRCVIALKGSGTVVSNGDRLYVNESGNPGMASGGTGDVLTGVIAGLIGQRMPAFEAAILGVYLHGLAGDYAAEELGVRSLTAADLLEFLPEALCEHDLSHTE